MDVSLWMDVSLCRSALGEHRVPWPFEGVVGRVGEGRARADGWERGVPSAHSLGGGPSHPQRAQPAGKTWRGSSGHTRWVGTGGCPRESPGSRGLSERCWGGGRGVVGAGPSGKHPAWGGGLGGTRWGCGCRGGGTSGSPGNGCSPGGLQPVSGRLSGGPRGAVPMGGCHPPRGPVPLPDPLPAGDGERRIPSVCPPVSVCASPSPSVPRRTSLTRHTGLPPEGAPLPTMLPCFRLAGAACPQCQRWWGPSASHVPCVPCHAAAAAGAWQRLPALPKELFQAGAGGRNTNVEDEDGEGGSSRPWGQLAPASASLGRGCHGPAQPGVALAGLGAGRRVFAL